MFRHLDPKSEDVFMSWAACCFKLLTLPTRCLLPGNGPLLKAVEAA